MAQNLENFLCTFHKKRYAHIVGNGTTAIYLAIKSLSNKIKYIGIPNNTCIHLPIAIKLANRIPVYLDIEKKGYGLSIKDLKKAKINCLINVHAYGKPSKIDKIKEICLKKKIFLIEDLALAQGGYYKKNPLGSFGNISILSFGKGKVVDAGIGGAMLTDDPNIYKLSKKIKNSFKLVNTNNLKHVSYINNLHTKIYNNYFLENKKINIKNFRRIIKLKSKYFLFNISPEQINKIEKEKIENNAFDEIIKQLPHSIKLEYAKIWKEYQDRISPESLIVHQIDRLEMALQAKTYQKLGSSKENIATFLETAKSGISHPKIKELVVSF